MERKTLQKNSNKVCRQSDTRIYRIWRAMKSRCYNKNFDEYSRYGKRGITVCDEWKDDFQAFYEWAISNGYESNLTIDRIDNNGNYCPQNCRWVTMKEQQNNRSNNHYVEINGVTKTITEWCESGEYEANYPTVKTRIRRGWSDVEAITCPVRKFSKDLTEEEKEQRKRKRLENIYKWQKENKEKFKEYQKRSEAKRKSKTV